MTLIIGILCQDGIVMGADGCATLGALGQRTITQTFNKKLEIISNELILGVSGPVGLGQQFKGEITQLWTNKALVGKQPHEAKEILRAALWKYARPALEAAAVARGALGNAALDSAISHTLLALPISGNYCLFQFDQQSAPEQVTEALPFVAIGSGEKTADPFLAFLRRVFWPDRLPPLEQGVFATVWTLEHAILTDPGGVKDPKQIVVYSKEHNQVKELRQEELKEAIETCYEAERYLADFPKTFEEAVEALSKEEIVKIPELHENPTPEKQE